MEELTSSLTAFDSWEEEEHPGPCTFSTSNNVNRLLCMYVDSIICILGFVGNILVILTLALEKKLNHPEVFQLNLAITNLFFIVALPFLIYNELFSWPMGQAACKLLQGSYSINLYSGMLLMAGMSIVHWYGTHTWKNTGSGLKMKCSLVSCALIWVVAILVSVPTFYFYHWYDPTSDDIIIPGSEEENKTSTSPQYFCEFRFKDSESSMMVKVAVPSIQMAVGFFLPLVIIISSYTSTIIILMEKKKPVMDSERKLFKKCSTRSEIHRHSSDNIEKATSMVTGIMLVFIVCHLPYNIILLYDTITMFQPVSCEVADSWQTALFITQTLTYVQCSLNPVVYGFLGGNFREKFRTVFNISPKTQKRSFRKWSSTAQ